MAKEKLFTPEDFDKNPKAPKKDIIKWIVGAIIVIIVIIAIIFGLKGCNSKTDSNPVEKINLARVIEEDSTVDTTQSEEISDKKKNVKEGSEVHTNSESEKDALQKNTTPSKQSSVQSTVSVSSDIESEAIKVIRGDYGNYPERKKALGDKYQLIQYRVNQLKHQGVF